MSGEDPTSATESAAAPALSLPLRLDLVWDEEREADLRSLTANPAGRARTEFWMIQFPCYLGLGIGIVGCLQAGQIFLAILIGCIWGYAFRYHLQVEKAMWTTSPFAGAPVQVVIIIEDTRIVQIDRGVESHMPWSCMARWLLYRGTLFIQLSNNQWAAIPSPQTPSSNFDIRDLASFLKIKGIAGKEVPVIPTRRI